MRKSLVFLGMVVALLAIGAVDVSAAGPFCFSTAPFADVFVWFLNPTGGNHFAGSGRDLTGDRPQWVTGFIVGNSAVVAYTTYAKATTETTLTGTGTLNLSSGGGPGRCFSPDFASCGNFTFTLVTCPAGAVADTAADASRAAGRFQGVSP
jgi:hypothetical protein